MKQLVLKEFKLAMHPTALIFLALSAMLLIPNYPYYVVFFYTGLAMFFTCLTGRENNDVFYSLLLPVKKSQVVGARMIYVVIMELLQMVLAIPCAYLRQQFPLPHNSVGMDANISLFAFSFILLGIFNVVFFGIYYKNVRNVGKAFTVASAIYFVIMGVMEVLTHIVPFLRDKLDTFDNQYVTEKLIILAIGAIVYTVLTFSIYKVSVKNFEKQDLN